MKSLHALIVLLLVLLGSPGAAWADSVGPYPDLRESYDPGLQSRLEATLRDLALAEAIEARQLAVALVDISNLHDPRTAAVNGDEMIYAASLPKIAILLGAFVEIERGRMALDASTREAMTNMIRVSSNEDATLMLNRVGKKRLTEILTSDPYRLYDPLVNGGLWVGKEYGKAPAYQRDPLHNLSHGATAMQAARFYYLMETGQLVSPRLSREMKAMLSEPGINHKFVKGLSDRQGVRIYRKSGTWQDWHADSALVEAGRHRYILVALAEHPRGGEWLVRMAGPLHDLIVRPRYVMADRNEGIR